MGRSWRLLWLMLWFVAWPTIGCERAVEAEAVAVWDTQLREPLGPTEHSGKYLHALRQLAYAAFWATPEKLREIETLVSRGSYGGWDPVAIMTFRQNTDVYGALRRR